MRQSYRGECRASIGAAELSPARAELGQVGESDRRHEPSGVSPAHSPGGLTVHAVAQLAAAHAASALVSLKQAAEGLHVSAQHTAPRPHPQ
jgi:hypothetical protein